jgi:anti-sigma regulatory factor (Ser/Thr protein kinase)
MVLPAKVWSAPLVRNRFRRWLSALRWPPEDRDDVVIAVHEAVTNVIDHAYRGNPDGAMRISARHKRDHRTGSEWVEVAVRDWGRWRPVPAYRGVRGHGLALMNGTMGRVEVHHRRDGTEVVMTSSGVDRAS